MEIINPIHYNNQKGGYIMKSYRKVLAFNTKTEESLLI